MVYGIMVTKTAQGVFSKGCNVTKTVVDKAQFEEATYSVRGVPRLFGGGSLPKGTGIINI